MRKIANAFLALPAGPRPVGHVFSYPRLPAGGLAVHSPLAAGSRSALTAGRRSLLPMPASPLRPRNQMLAHLGGGGAYSTAERGVPSLLKGNGERIASDILQLVGWTPMVELNKMAEGCGARIVAKLEYYQPLASIKDRAALRMIEDAEERGLIKPGTSILVEMTSGNTGIGLAYVAALKGYEFIAIMPADYSLEKQTLMVYLGAKVVLSDPSLGTKGMGLKLKELRIKIPNLHYMDQFANPANPDAHCKWTGPEIWKDTAGHIDILVAAAGTAGTVTGLGRYLKSKNAAIKVICVEPAESQVLSGCKYQAHKIQGVGIDSVPRNFDRSIIDEIIPVSSEIAIKYARRLAAEEGLLAGISSGANIAVSLQVAEREDSKGKMIVTIFPSGGERYMSSELFEEARREAEALWF